MKKDSLLYFLLLVISCIGCRQIDPVSGDTELQSGQTDEVSGVISSRLHKNVLFVHNDSGDISRFFAIDTKGRLISILSFQGDPEEGWFGGVEDCEDIAAGPGPVKGKPYIYLADIGDNRRQRESVSIYRFREPEKLVPDMHLSYEIMHYTYPDGPRDAETLLVDPLSSQLYVISKREDSVGIYSTPLLFKNDSRVVLQKKGKMHLDDADYYRWITGGDISPDGKKILVRSYRAVYYWVRQGNEPVEKTLQRKPVEIPCNPEKQGEAIGFTPNGKACYCISEGKNAAIHYHELPEN